MLADVWKIKDKETKDIITYAVQFSDVNKKDVKSIIKMMKDWNNFADGLNTKTKRVILLFKKNFSTQYEWTKWSRSFPYELFEMKEDGKKEKIKKYKSGKKTLVLSSTKGRVCSGCGASGHNKRTCPERSRNV